MLRNRLLRAQICPEKGNLTALHLATERGFQPWNARVASLRITDDLRQRTFSDSQNPMTLTTRRTRSRVENVKRFRGADFVVKETWRTTRDALIWTVKIALKPGRKARSIRVEQLVPYPDPCYGLGVWTAHPNFPTMLGRLGGLNLQYGEICYGTALPSLTFYSQADNVGLTVAKPFGLRTSRLAFSFMDYRSAGVELDTSMLALRRGKPAKTEFMFHPHEGCWRPGLAWLYQEYPRYFNPPNSAVRDIEGGYLLGHPSMTEEEIASVAPHGLKWEELHCHFEWMGDYVPEKDEWTCCDTWEACVAWDVEANAVQAEAAEAAEAPSAHKRVSKQMIRDHIDRVHAHKIKTLYYWQCAGDAPPPLQEKFPDALARDGEGNPYPSCPGNVLMNADPQTSFGRDMLRQIRRVFQLYPHIDGVFLDQLCYDALDYAHDDGVTMIDNQPAYRLWHGYEEPVRKLAAAVHRRGKLIFANGPHNVEVQRDMDGIMAEGASWLADVVKYLCIAKPLLFLAFYHADPRAAEAMFQRCLLDGASYSLFPFPPKPVVRVINTYRPLVEKLLGRKWLLEPDPLTLPDGADGNIFHAENGDVLIPVVSTRKSFLDKGGITRNMVVRARFKAAAGIKSAVTLGTHYKGQRKAGMTRKGNELEVTVPAHDAATLIVLRKSRP